MSSRDTRTGNVLEQMVIPALERGHYSVETQVEVGARPGGGIHKVDLVATDNLSRSFLVSSKWQQTSGTAEQKVPYEVICLAHAIRSSEGRYAAAYLVLGGSGWRLREFYVGGGLRGYIVNIENVFIMSLEKFVACANQGSLHVGVIENANSSRERSATSSRSHQSRLQ